MSVAERSRKDKDVVRSARSRRCHDHFEHVRNSRDGVVMKSERSKSVVIS